MRKQFSAMCVVGCLFFTKYIKDKIDSNETRNRNVVELSSVPDTLRSLNSFSIFDSIIEVKPVVKKKNHKGLSSFLRAVGRSEGLGKYDIVNSYGYLGMYQFHPNTLDRIGIDVSRDEFLNTPELQDTAMVRYMKLNSRILRKVIRDFSGTYYNGVYVTKSGILAGAHLVGAGGVKAYFYPDSALGHSTKDANGTTVERYIEKFAGYELRGI